MQINNSFINLDRLLEFLPEYGIKNLPAPTIIIIKELNSPNDRGF
jgi:hypothetical protein